MTVEEILDRAARELALEGLEECGRMPEILEQEEHKKEACGKWRAWFPRNERTAFGYGWGRMRRRPPRWSSSRGKPCTVRARGM